jgi:hypothetical protein
MGKSLPQQHFPVFGDSSIIGTNRLCLSDVDIELAISKTVRNKTFLAMDARNEGQGTIEDLLTHHPPRNPLLIV